MVPKEYDLESHREQIPFFKSVFFADASNAVVNHLFVCSAPPSYNYLLFTMSVIQDGNHIVANILL